MIPPRHTSHSGYVLLVALVSAAIFITVSTALVRYLTEQARSARAAIASGQALALAEGGMDKAIYELNQNASYAGETDTVLGAGTFTVAVATIDGATKQVAVTAHVPNSAAPLASKTVRAAVAITADVISFHYGVQAGEGGFTLENSAEIHGNVFSGGSVAGSSANMIYGTVVSAGPTGWVYGVHATSSVYAHTIGKTGETTIVDGDAYYVAKINTVVNGASHPNSPDQALVGLPISDDQITEWENDAAAGGTITACDSNGNYSITESVSLGPKKIACNLVVKSSSGVLTVTGPLWVTGNITTQTGPTIKMDPNLGSQNVPIIADNPANPTGSGTISVGQSTAFEGSGAPGSFVFLISQNRSAESGGGTAAIDMNQGASALVAYASHGLLTLSQSVDVKQATGYKIALSQSAAVTYDTGLPHAVFESGAGGSWTFVPGTYSITN